MIARRMTSWLSSSHRFMASTLGSGEAPPGGNAGGNAGTGATLATGVSLFHLDEAALQSEADSLDRRQEEEDQEEERRVQQDVSQVIDIFKM